MLPTALRINWTVRAAEMASLGRRLLPGSFASDEHAIDALIDYIQNLNDTLGISTATLTGAVSLR